MTGEQTVLVVDDEPDIAELYATWLETGYEVRTASGGEEALDAVDGDVDVVLLDRQMPDCSGDEVLDRLRERGLECRVVMVTAVDPDFDIVEMVFDDYLTKPVSREDLVGAVEEMRERDEYDRTVREFFSLASKKATLEAEKTRAELQDSEEYRQMTRQVEELEAEAERVRAGFEGEFDSLFREFGGE